MFSKYFMQVFVWPIIYIHLSQFQASNSVSLSHSIPITVPLSDDKLLELINDIATIGTNIN
jgi:hypothetical protein